MIGRGWGLVLIVVLGLGIPFKKSEDAPSQALNPRCMTAIVQSAYRNQMVFAQEGIVLASHIHNCENLRGSYRRLLAKNKSEFGHRRRI